VNFDDLLSAPQYSLTQRRKEAELTPQFRELTLHHLLRCPAYARLLSVIYPESGAADSLAAIPFIPISLFKTHRLSSIPDSDVFKTLTSSGTSGQQVSQIVLDRETARRQTIALSRIMTSVLGPERLPMILVESETILKDRLHFNARAAGVLGMMNFGRRHFYALDEAMNLDEAGLRSFLSEFSGKPFLIFGFTFMVWQYLFLRVAHLGLDLSQGVLVHSGGWKKLEEMAVTNADFRHRFAEATGLKRIYNFYGMAEQVGMGVIRGIDDSTCGRAGKYFSVLGRVPQAELRGCSDVHASQVSA
jgi:hypothetical protein